MNISKNNKTLWTIAVSSSRIFFCEQLREIYSCNSSFQKCQGHEFYKAFFIESIKYRSKKPSPDVLA